MVSSRGLVINNGKGDGGVGGGGGYKNGKRGRGGDGGKFYCYKKGGGGKRFSHTVQRGQKVLR